MISAENILTPSLSANSCASLSIFTSNARTTAYLKEKANLKQEDWVSQI